MNRAAELDRSLTPEPLHSVPGSLQIKTLERSDNARWDTFVNQCSEATFFHRGVPKRDALYAGKDYPHMLADLVTYYGVSLDQVLQCELRLEYVAPPPPKGPPVREVNYRCATASCTPSFAASHP